MEDGGDGAEAVERVGVSGMGFMSPPTLLRETREFIKIWWYRLLARVGGIGRLQVVMEERVCVCV